MDFRTCSNCSWGRGSYSLSPRGELAWKAEQAINKTAYTYNAIYIYIYALHFIYLDKYMGSIKNTLVSMTHTKNYTCSCQYHFESILF